jgi:hypothetical protein
MWDYPEIGGNMPASQVPGLDWRQRQFGGRGLNRVCRSRSPPCAAWGGSWRVRCSAACAPALSVQADRNFPDRIVDNAARMPPLVLRVLHMSRDLPPLLAGLGDLAEREPPPP